MFDSRGGEDSLLLQFVATELTFTCGRKFRRYILFEAAKSHDCDNGLSSIGNSKAL